MNLYLISQTENNGYDTYDSAVVCAENEEEAKKICPSVSDFANFDEEANKKAWKYDEWAGTPENVNCDFLGKAEPKIKKGVICASFNAE